ncbi:MULTISPECIES: peptidylprolyl isomerase PpiC [Marinomonas]|uniref:peptidylprolyl isomerase n=1 Tax=Marinomonas arenicola TaxID=569601 RepID=A0ABU9G5C8_9GAMM|nr:peptidylprolyl isomerase PpiC [Marinomonas sp. KMM3893]
MATASACHILVKTKAEAESIKGKLDKGADFYKLAKQFSTCPSGKKGGDLGEFRKGDMVAAFDKAVFSGPLLKVQGPIKTQFGFHLIKVLYRS